MSFSLKNDNNVIDYLHAATQGIPIAMSDETRDVLMDMEANGLIEISRLYPSAKVTILPQGIQFWRNYLQLQRL